MLKLSSKHSIANTKALEDALRDADIARLMGNPDWRDVFKRHSYKITSPTTKKMLLELSRSCTESALRHV